MNHHEIHVLRELLTMIYQTKQSFENHRCHDQYPRHSVLYSQLGLKVWGHAHHYHDYCDEQFQETHFK